MEHAITLRETLLPTFLSQCGRGNFNASAVEGSPTFYYQTPDSEPLRGPLVELREVLKNVITLR